jgi:hypothetical protein
MKIAAVRCNFFIESKNESLGTAIAYTHLSLIGFGFPWATQRGGESVMNHRIHRPLFFHFLDLTRKYFMINNVMKVGTLLA